MGWDRERIHSPSMIHDASLDSLLQKVWDGRRIDRAEALRLAKECPGSKYATVEVRPCAPRGG